MHTVRTANDSIFENLTWHLYSEKNTLETPTVWYLIVKFCRGLTMLGTDSLGKQAHHCLPQHSKACKVPLKASFSRSSVSAAGLTDTRKHQVEGVLTLQSLGPLLSYFASSSLLLHYYLLLLRVYI